MRKIILNINDRDYKMRVEESSLLLDVIREQALLTGTKQGCGTGECGACTVIVDGIPVNSCLYLAIRAEGKKIFTIEGLGVQENLHPLQKAFIEHGAVQCGFCAPGMLLSAKALLDKKIDPSEFEIRNAISGNLCRCSGYVKIVEAIKTAAKWIGAKNV
jgi:carbon-monoxide dehydrogenase small subunit